MKELTTEQLEIARAEEEKKIVKQSIQAGKDLIKLRKDPAFKRLFEGLFIKSGREILWDNLQHLIEGQLQGRGSDQNLAMIEKLKGQVKSRLDLETFMNTVEYDYDNVLAEIEEQEADAKREAATQKAAS